MQADVFSRAPPPPRCRYEWRRRWWAAWAARGAAGCKLTLSAPRCGICPIEARPVPPAARRMAGVGTRLAPAAETDTGRMPLHSSHVARVSREGSAARAARSAPLDRPARPPCTG